MLLQELIAVLKPQAQQEAHDVFFTRQLHERVCGLRLKKPISGWTNVRLVDGQVSVVEEFWSLERLLKFQPWHNRTDPRKQDVPLVIFRGWRVQALIDGQTRVNHWQLHG